MSDSILLWFKSFIPAKSNVDRFERMRACAGSLFGILLAGLASHALLGAGAAAWLIAPMGASAVLLFAVPSSPLAQPWSIIGGNLCSALIGVTCARLVGDAALASSLAIALAIGAMLALRCVHPPSGAVALTAVLGGPVVTGMGYQFVLVPVLLNSVLLLGAALFYNNATGRRYPHAQQTPQSHLHPHHTGDALPIARLGFSPEDLDAVLRDYNQVIDIGRDDLEEIFIRTEMRAYHRRFGQTSCEMVMSRDVVAVEFATSLDEAWNLLQSHRLRALPVVSRARHVIGIVSRTDFLEHAGVEVHTGLAAQLRKLLHRVPWSHSDKPEVVGQIMSRPVVTAQAASPVLELVPRMAEGLHQIPVVDEQGKLVGMLTQSDMIAALYEKNLVAAGLRSAA